MIHGWAFHFIFVLWYAQPLIERTTRISYYRDSLGRSVVWAHGRRHYYPVH